jgi:hypothetical protein
MNHENILNQASKLLKGFNFKSMSLGKGINQETGEEKTTICVSVEKLYKDLPNTIEIEGEEYPIDQRVSKFQFLNGEMSWPTSKPEGERLQKWRTIPAGLRGMIFENDCAQDDGSANREKIRPIKCGSAITTDKENYGTLGCLAIDKQDGKLVGVTNAHVVAKNFLISSELNDKISPSSVADTPVYQGNIENIATLGSDDVIGTVKRYFPIGVPYKTNHWHSVDKDQFQIDAALIALSKDVVDANSWQLVGIDNSTFNSPVTSYLDYEQFLSWLYDSYWGSYGSEVGGGKDEFGTPQESLMLTSGARTGAKDGDKELGDKSWRWRIIGPYKFQEVGFDDGAGNPIIKLARENVAIARQENVDRYKGVDGAVARGDWYCANSTGPGDSGSVLYSYFNNKWSIVGIIYAAQTADNGIAQEALLIPFYLVAEIMGIEPWDGTISDDIFYEEENGRPKCELIYTRGKNPTYKHTKSTDGGNKYFYQAGTVERQGNRVYEEVQESFLQGGDTIIPVNANISSFVSYDDINIDIPTEGSWDPSITDYDSDPIWFNFKNLNILNDNLPNDVKNPQGDVAMTLDIAVVAGEQFGELDGFYFDKENRSKYIYASKPIVEFYGNGVSDSSSRAETNALSKIKSLLGGGKGGSANGLKFADLSKTRFKRGAKGSVLPIIGSEININNANCFTEYIPWETIDGFTKGAAKTNPPSLEEWIKTGAKLCLVLTYIGKDNEYVIDKLAVKDLTAGGLGQFPLLEDEAVDDDVVGDPIFKFGIDTNLSATLDSFGGHDFLEAGGMSVLTGFDDLFKSDIYKRTIVLPILETGESPVTIDWGDGSPVTTIPANFNFNNSSQNSDGGSIEMLRIFRKVIAYLEGYNDPETYFDYENEPTLALAHRYAAQGAKTITISGPVKKFGHLGMYDRYIKDGVDVHRRNRTTSGHFGNYFREGGLDHGNFVLYSMLFSSKVRRIDKFPTWPKCEWYYAFILSNIQFWNTKSKFAGFKCIGAFVSHIKNQRTRQWVSAGFSSWFCKAGPFDNWEFPNFYDEDLPHAKGRKYNNTDGGLEVFTRTQSLYDDFKGVWIPGLTEGSGIDNIWGDYWRNNTFSLPDTFFNEHGPARMWVAYDGGANTHQLDPLTDNRGFIEYYTISQILFNDDVVFNADPTSSAKITQDRFYQKIYDSVKENGHKMILKNSVDLSSLETTKFDFYKMTPYSNEITQRTLQWISGDSTIVDSSATVTIGAKYLDNYKAIKKIVDSGAKVAITEAIESLDDFFRDEVVSSKDINFLKNNVKLANTCSFNRTFMGAELRGDIDISQLVLAGGKLREMFRDVKGSNSTITIGEIVNPISVESFLQNASIKNISGIDKLTLSETSVFNNLFYNANIGTSLTNIGLWNISESSIFTLISEKALNLKNGSENRPNAFLLASSSVGEITLPENLSFIDEIVDYFRVHARLRHEHNDSPWGVRFGKGVSYQSQFARSDEYDDHHITNPDFSKPGKYAFLIDSGDHLQYKLDNLNGMWKYSDWHMEYDLGLYESDSGWFSKTKYNEETGLTDHTEVTDPNLFKKYRVGYGKYDWTLNAVNSVYPDQLKQWWRNTSIGVASGIGLGTSYWAIIDINKEKYTSTDIHIKFKPDPYITNRHGLETKAEMPDKIEAFLWFPNWNGGYDWAPRGLLWQQKNP